MPTGVTRILPFAAISAVLHAAAFMNVPEGVEIAVTPDGDTGPVSVRLVPSGATAPDPAAQSGVAGSIPETSRERVEPAESPPTTDGADKTAEPESHKPSEQAATEPDRVQAASVDRNTPKAKPKDTDQKRGETVSAEQDDAPVKSGPAPDTAEESTEDAASAKSETSTTPENTQASHAADAGKARESEPDKESSASRAAEEIAEAASGRNTSDESDAVKDDRQRKQEAGAEGRDDRAQLASRARQQVEIHFREQFRYPRIARQRGWEGRVVLTFRLQPDGRITDVEVTESSGRSILDENARQTLVHIQRVPEIADRLQSGALELEVPVTYRLQPV